jgi:hypothetical protein
MVAILTFFYILVAAGCIHTWIAWNYYPNHGDIWEFFTNSFTTRPQLLTSFHTFWIHNNRLADLPHNLIEWLHLIFNIASRDNLYINTLFFCFLTLTGFIALFETCYHRLNKDFCTASAALLLPSVLFWTGCIQTEGIVYSLLGWLLYILDDPRRSNSLPYRIIMAAAITGFIIFQRQAIAIGLLPAIFIWLLANKDLTRRQWLGITAAITLLLASAIILAPSLFSPFFHTIADRQAEFQTLPGKSRIYLPILHPSFDSFIQILPSASFNAFFQPLPGAGGQSIYLAFTAELAIIWLLIICSLVRCWIPAAKPTGTSPAPRTFIAICLIFAIPSILLIGYIVPFVGAIVRYRSIYLPFLLMPFLHFLHCPFLARINTWLTKSLINKPHF